MKLTTYTPEFRAEAVKVMLAQKLSLEAAALRLATPKEALGNWGSVAKRSGDTAAAPGSRSARELEVEVANLRQELAMERMEKEVLKKLPRTLPGSCCPVRILEIRAAYPLGLLCRVFHISRSGFYA